MNLGHMILAAGVFSLVACGSTPNARKGGSVYSEDLEKPDILLEETSSNYQEYGDRNFDLAINAKEHDQIEKLDPLEQGLSPTGALRARHPGHGQRVAKIKRQQEPAQAPQQAVAEQPVVGGQEAVAAKPQGAVRQVQEEVAPVEQAPVQSQREYRSETAQAQTVQQQPQQQVQVEEGPSLDEVASELKKMFKTGPTEADHELEVPDPLLGEVNP